MIKKKKYTIMDVAPAIEILSNEAKELRDMEFYTEANHSAAAIETLIRATK